jgi:hypothetical protein
MKAISVSIVLFVAISFSSFSARAQDQGSAGSERPAVITAPNAIYVEALGTGFIYSINYERSLGDMFSARIGFGYFPFPSITDTNANGTTSTVNASITSVPVSVSFYPFGATSSKLEIGAGATYIDLVAKKVGKSKEGGGSGENISGILGYRYQPLDGGFLFRISFTPIFSSPIFTKFQPWGGVSLGWAL